MMRALAFVLALATLLGARAAAQKPASPPAAPDTVWFSAGELYGAFSLTMSHDHAYRLTKALSTPIASDTSIKLRRTDGRVLSEDILLMLALGSDSTAAKVDLVRRRGRASIPENEQKQWREKLDAMRKLSLGPKSP